LTAPLKWIASRLRDRPDSEHEMSFNRLVFATIIVAVLLANRQGNNLDYALFAMALYIALALAVLGHILISPGVSRARRLFALLLDCGFLSWQLHLGGEVASLFFPIYLWVIFGNGFRFGLPSLATAIPVATACFSAVVVTTPFWRDQWHLSLGLLIGLVILPAYAGTLIRKLSQATRTAEEASRAKSAFLASVSHELRTPLTAIVGMTGLLRTSPLVPDQREMVETIDVASRSLQALINGLLDLSRIEAGRMPVSSGDFDLVALLVDARRLVETQVRERGLTFDIHVTARTPLRLHGSRQHLHEILVNLVGNAVKFTRDGGVTIGVDATSDPDKGLQLAMEITDTGIGIAPSDQERIFEDFTQANPGIMNRFGGTGLGLAISRRLVELLGGTISVESELDEGSTFRFQVPIALAIDEGLDDAAWHRRGVVLVCRDKERLGPLIATLDAVGARPMVADPRLGPARMLPADARDAIRMVFEPDANLPMLATGAMAAPSKPILIRPNTSPVLPRVDIRQRCVVALSMVPTNLEVRRALTLACRLAAPLSPAPHAEPPRLVRPEPRCTVLLADDNPINQKVFSRILEGAGHVVILADTGSKALDLMEERRANIDIVLMDFNMPETDGLETTKLYRVMSAGDDHLPIVGLTADATALTDSRWRNAGMDACLIKPIEPEALLAAVSRIARRRPGKNVEPASRPEPIRHDILPTLDEVMIERLGKLGSPQFVLELMEDFLADAETIVGRLSESAARGDITAFRSDDHALMSSAANIGAVALGHVCKPWRALRGDELKASAADFARHARAELKRTEKAIRLHSAAQSGRAR